MSRVLASLSCVAGGVLAAAIAVHGQAPTWQPPDASGQGQAPIMPVHQEPHHRQLFLAGVTRLIDLQIPPGDASWFHTHEWPVFYLTVADSQTRTQVFGQEWGATGRGRGAAPAGRGAPPPGGAPAAGAAPAAGGAPAPRAGGPPAGPRAGGPAPRAGGAGGRGGGFRPRLMSNVEYAPDRVTTHRIENIGTGLYRALGVINESQGGDEAVTEEAAGFSGKAESSNRWFRVHRVALAPGQKTAQHQHKAPVVVLQDSAGKGLATGPMTFEFGEPGAWGYFAAGAGHALSNTGDTPLELLEVEVRTR